MLGGSALVKKGGFGGGEKNISGQYRGRQGTATAGKRRAEQIAEGRGEGSSRLARKKSRMGVPGVRGMRPFLRLL